MTDMNKLYILALILVLFLPSCKKKNDKYKSKVHWEENVGGTYEPSFPNETEYWKIFDSNNMGI
jgi:hypothetical protein